MFSARTVAVLLAAALTLAPTVQAVEGTLELKADVASFSGTFTQGGNQPIRTAFGPLRLDYKSGANTWTTGLLMREGDGNITIGAAITSSDFTATSKLRVLGTVESTTGGFKFPDGSTQTAAAAAIPAGLVSFFNLSACPSGWTELTAARGMYIVGLPAAGTLAGTSGTALTNLESRPVGQHTHTITISDPGHSHSVTALSTGCGNCSWRFAGATTNDGGGVGGGTSSNTTGITASAANSGSVAGTNAPYIQLLACEKS